jgi:Arc/MetJ-type ribon-helix-helix transcriptional regulator
MVCCSMTERKSPGPGVREGAPVFADDKARETAFAELRRALEEGEASGPAEPFDLEEFLAECRRERQARGG